MSGALRCRSGSLWWTQWTRGNGIAVLAAAARALGAQSIYACPAVILPMRSRCLHWQAAHYGTANNPSLLELTTERIAWDHAVGDVEPARQRTRVISAACLSTICILGMPRRGVHQPYRLILIIDDVADPASAGYLILPLLKVPAVVAMRRQVTTQPMLPVMVSSRAWY
jgi:hypothetical protein